MIPYSAQTIDQDDIKSVSKALKSKFLTQGPKVIKFENSLSKLLHAKFCLTTNSASSALLLACKVLGLKKNDIAWTVPNTYVATANAIIHSGLKIDFVDIDKDTYNISLDKLSQKLAISKKKKKLPKLIIPVHFSGLPCDMKRLKDLSNIYKFKIIEDASHALGSKYRNIFIGSCKYSDLAVFSFHPIKIITTGEGGAITTNKIEYYNKLSFLRSGGIIKKKQYLINKNMPEWYYEQHYLGYNFRLNDIQAALGLSQLKKLKKLNNLRKKIATRYFKELKDLPLNLPINLKFYKSSFHLFVVTLKQTYNQISRNEIYKKLKKKGIETNVLYIPLYLHPYYKNMKIDKKNLFNSYDYYNNVLSLPIYPKMSFKTQTYVIKSLKEILS